MTATPLPEHNMPEQPARRSLLAGAVVALTGLLLRPGAALAAAANAGTAALVNIAEFAGNGARLRVVKLPVVVKTDEAWRAQLSPLAYQVTRHEGTERAFSGKYAESNERGIYRCICCDTALFSSATKFDSGTGWPSFWQPIARENVVQHEDRMYFMVRVAVSCRRCAAHLGHVFDDGPEPTGKRYCMNSVALRLAPLTA